MWAGIRNKCFPVVSMSGIPSVGEYGESPADLDPSFLSRGYTRIPSCHLGFSLPGAVVNYFPSSY